MAGARNRTRRREGAAAPAWRDEAQRIALQLLEQGYADGLKRRLQQNFRRLREQDLEDAIGEAFEALANKLKRGERLDVPEAYVFKVACFVAMRRLRTVRRTMPFEEGQEGHDRAKEDEVPSDDAAEHAMEFLLETVRRWTTSNVQRTMLIVLEAARLGEPLADKEIAQKLRANGEELADVSVRVWKKRGIDALREQVAESGVKYADFALKKVEDEGDDANQYDE